MFILESSAEQAYSMGDETAAGSAGAPNGKGHSKDGVGVGSPLQTRAAFLKNWDWQSVVSINRGACERARAQHGINSETGKACAQEWETFRSQILTLAEILDSLRGFHRKAPFLFFNGNTFASIGRELTLVLFSDLVPGRRREMSSAVAHYIAGVLDRQPMVEIVESLCQSAELKAGDRVKTLRGSLRGKILSILPDGRVQWQPDGSHAQLTALPESLLRI
jgi:hypothetical protein